MEFLQLRRWIDSQQADFLALLQQLVEINSFTSNHAGVDAAMEVVCQAAERMGFQVDSILERHRLVRSGKGKRILLVSHIDTVHPPDGDFLHYEPQADGYVRGPGIGDMKSGLLMGLWTLKAVRELGVDADLQLVVSADEEYGSPTIKNWYAQTGADFALGLEPNFPQGSLTPEVILGFVEQRKGCGRVDFKIRGKAAHSGGAWQDGINAIEAAAHRILKIQALTDLERGMTTSVGLVNGGTAANTVAEFCEVAVDYRFVTQKDGREILEAIQQIVEGCYLFNSHLSLNESVENFSTSAYLPPMEKTNNQELVALVMHHVQRLGLKMKPISRGGGSDANHISGSGVPAICGMGAPAEGIHTPQERILVPRMWESLELLISTVYSLTAQ
ncbi:MAG: M20/M25/M40 family metallo-hydrolase [Anaerolineae bacterium]|nr:M20/M25/M40 family metallo-hydrolase [Anaerolineae bacterium]